MPIIESYSFGQMIIDGKNYTKDIIIYPDNSFLCPWWRQSGHRLELSDIEKLIGMKPDIIVAGTGANGLMRPSEELRKVLEEENIEFITLPTGKATEAYNEHARNKRTGACFHLTC